MKRRKQVNKCQVVGDSERAVVKSPQGRLLEEFDNAKADRLAVKMQPDAFARACQWARDAMKYG